jgi:deoxyribonuclease V
MKIQELHSWNLSPKEAVQLQRELAARIICSPSRKVFNLIAGADISFSKGSKLLFASVVILDIKNLQVIETVTHVEQTRFPYIPGLLAFREIPPLLAAFEKLTLKPDAVICDGQGVAHPRKMGLATHLGLWLGIPTIGCAKTPLVGKYSPFPLEKGNDSELFFQEEKVGVVLCTKTNVKPLFISPGHLTDIDESKKVVLDSLGRCRLPEPTRQAHLAVNRSRVLETKNS